VSVNFLRLLFCKMMIMFRDYGKYIALICGVQADRNTTLKTINIRWACVVVYACIVMY